MASGSDGLAKADFDVNRLSPLEISEELAHALGLKGYCQLRLGLDEGLDDVLEEVKNLHASERFAAPPVEVLEGVLGPEGSAELAWLPYPYSGEFADGEALQALTKDLSYLAGHLRPFYEGIGADGATLRLSQTAVIRGGEHEEDDAPALTEELCSFWLSLFMSPTPLMLLYFLGPDRGTLELRPLDEDSDAVLLTTEPDTLVVVRADLLSHSHTASSDNYLLCSWLTTPILTGPRGWEMAKSGPGCLAALKGLSGWIEERLAVLRHSQEENNMLNDTPRCWQRVMRTHLSSTADIPVGVAGHVMHGASWDCDEFWKTLTGGVDFVSEVPLQRWNHSNFYDPDPEAFLQSHVCTGGVTKTAMRHVMFIEGSDLFDPKPFQLSQSESTGMDVQQRHCIECHYASLLQAGYRKKELMNNFIAVFMGGTQPECNYTPYPHGSGGGNLSPAIIANRTSFVMGLQGPSSVIDCEMASAGMALVVGATAVAPNNPYRTECGGDSKAACCGGVYICLTPFMWPRWEAWMNPAGRCFTFDHSAGGYVMGEGCSVAALKAYYDKVAGELITSDATFDGALVAWKHSNSGAGASLTAPHAMGIQEVIYKAYSAAGISPLDLDAVDCDGRGGLLDDSVELSATARVCRSVAGSREEPLAIGAAKSNVGAHREVASMAHFIKVLMNIKYASQAPGLHLRVLNPHCELASGALFVNMEALPYRDMHPFHGMNSRGWGGSNVHIIQWNKPDPSIAPTGAPEPRRSSLAFWPGGAGCWRRAAALRPRPGTTSLGRGASGGTRCRWPRRPTVPTRRGSGWARTGTRPSSSGWTATARGCSTRRASGPRQAPLPRGRRGSRRPAARTG